MYEEYVFELGGVAAILQEGVAGVFYVVRTIVPVDVCYDIYKLQIFHFMSGLGYLSTTSWCAILDIGRIFVVQMKYDLWLCRINIL